jgi:glutathione synthase/RimK-type ligase-like ATP-grasp enzyme
MKRRIEKMMYRGFQTVLVDYYDNPIALHHADTHHQISTLFKESMLNLAKAEKAHLVIGACVEQDNVTACYLSEKPGLPGPNNYQTALLVTNKVLMKDRLCEAGVNSPKFVCVADLHALGNLELAFLLIAKPPDSCGSKG